MRRARPCARSDGSFRTGRCRLRSLTSVRLPANSWIHCQSSPRSSSVSTIETPRTSDSDVQLVEDAALEVLAFVTAFLTAIGGLEGGLDADLPASYKSDTHIHEQIVDRMLGRALGLGLQKRAVLLHGALRVLGILERQTLEGTSPNFAARYEVRETIWSRVPTALTDLRGLFEEAYGWGTPVLDEAKLFGAVADSAASLGAFAEVRYPNDAYAIALTGTPGAEPTASLSMTLISFDEHSLDLVLYPLPKASAGDIQRLALVLVASGNLDRQILLGNLTLGIDIDVDASAGVGIILEPDAAPRLITGVTGTPSETVTGSIVVSGSLLLAEEGERVNLLSAPPLALGLESVYAKLGLRGSGAGLDTFVELGAKGGRLAIAGGGGGFVDALVPESGFTVDFDFGIGWSSGRGVYLVGSSVLSVTIPTTVNFGPDQHPRDHPRSRAEQRRDRARGRCQCRGGVWPGQLGRRGRWTLR